MPFVKFLNIIIPRHIFMYLHVGAMRNQLDRLERKTFENDLQNEWGNLMGKINL